MRNGARPAPFNSQSVLLSSDCIKLLVSNDYAVLSSPCPPFELLCYFFFCPLLNKNNNNNLMTNMQRVAKDKKKLYNRRTIKYHSTSFGCMLLKLCLVWYKIKPKQIILSIVLAKHKTDCFADFDLYCRFCVHKKNRWKSKRSEGVNLIQLVWRTFPINRVVSQNMFKFTLDTISYNHWPFICIQYYCRQANKFKNWFVLIVIATKHQVDANASASMESWKATENKIKLNKTCERCDDRQNII